MGEKFKNLWSRLKKSENVTVRYAKQILDSWIVRNFHGQKTLTRLTTSFILTKLRHSNQRTDLKFLTSGTCQDTGSLEQISSESPMGS